ncbi:MAG: MgtC/SapB family protein [Pseudomonadales bacterium]
MEWVEHRILGLAVALGLGLLVGLQREWATDKRIGLRSFALISTIGGILGVLPPESHAWLVAAGMLSVTIAVFAHAYFVSRHTVITGMTTELAAITTFLIGFLASAGYMVSAVVLAGAVTLLLHWKGQLHALVSRIGETEFQAIAQFVLITLVVLPILPDRTYGPYAVLNPREIWLVVVLIVGLNLVGYVALKLSSERGGALASGVLGGLISSTATTVSFSGRSRDQPALAPMATIVILVASLLVYLRIVVETTAVARALVPHLLWPVAAFTALFLLAAGWRLRRFEPVAGALEQTGNPAELKTALSFGALYLLVLLISAAVNQHLGGGYLYAVAVVSGLTDVDAITLSTARLFANGSITADTAWRVIMIASLANLAFKGGIVMIAGGPALRRQLLPSLLALTSIGVAGTLLWP